MPDTTDTVNVPRAVLVDLARLLERLVVSSARIGSWQDSVSVDEGHREFGRWATDSDLTREAAARRREVFTLDRGVRSCLGRSQITSPWDIVRLDLDAGTNQYVGTELYKVAGYGSGVTWESADYLLRFNPVSVAGRISPRPLLIVHGAENRLHRPEEAHELYEAAGEPKRLELLDGCGHTEWMTDEHPMFRHVVQVIDDFLRRSKTGNGDRM